jgi:hypothetical protein
MKKTLTITTLLAALTFAGGFVAAQDKMAGHNMDQMNGGSHQGMQMDASSIMLGEENVDGVTAMAHLNDVGAMMAKMGHKENYHFMVMFSEAASGKPVQAGTVAVKIVDAKTGQPGAPIMLMGMGNHFGADILLPDNGKYTFEVGTKLADGKKRQYSFQFTR